MRTTIRTSGAVGCCRGCGELSPAVTGDSVVLVLDRTAVPALPEEIKATVVGAVPTPIAGVAGMEYTVEFPDSSLTGTGVQDLQTCLIKDIRCWTPMDGALERIAALESRVAGLENP